MVNLWKRLGFLLTGSVSESQVEKLARLGKEAFEKAQSGAELEYLDKRESEHASNLAAAASQVILSLKDEPEAVLRLGQLLILKVTTNGKSRIIAETVSTDIRRILDQNPKLLNSPPELLRLIQAIHDKKPAANEKSSNTRAEV